MRYILSASILTLALIAGLLALPSIGQPHARLVDVSLGERLAPQVQGEVLTAAGRRLAEPGAPPSTSTTTEATTRALALAAEPPSDTLDRGEPSTGGENDLDTSLGTDEAPATTDAPTTTASTAAPTTSTTTTTSTTSTTTTSTTTTSTTVAPEDLPDSGGVLISPTGVVMPVIGRSSAGWRAMTPCGVEVTLDRGERVMQVDWVIDPGHGGRETGAVGPNGAVEKVLNVRIAEIVEWYLEEAGYSVLLTRRDDIRIPLRSRAEIANALQPKAFVSIHHNGGATRPQATPGTEIFVDAGAPEARRLGGILFEELQSRMQRFDADWVGSSKFGVSSRLNDDGADLYGIHRYTPEVISVITEVGYLSNASEEAVYIDNEAQWAHGRAIADGLMRWDRTSDAGSGFLPDFVDSSSSGTGGFDGCVDPPLG